MRAPDLPLHLDWTNMIDLRSTLLQEKQVAAATLEELTAQSREIEARIKRLGAKIAGIDALIKLEDEERVAILQRFDDADEAQLESDGEVERYSVDGSFSATLFAAIDRQIVYQGEADLREVYDALPKELRENFEEGGSSNSAEFRARRLVRRSARYAITRGSDKVTLRDGQMTAPPPPSSVPKNPLTITKWTESDSKTRIYWKYEDTEEKWSSFDQFREFLKGGGSAFIRTDSGLTPVAMYRKGKGVWLSSYENGTWTAQLSSLREDNEAEKEPITTAAP